MRSSSLLQDVFYAEREKLKQQVAENLTRNMASMVGHKDTSDVLLVSADGFKLPVHLCILRRSPVFFQRYVEPTLKASPRNSQRLLEVAVGDVDFNGLSFFVRSIYTDEEIAELPTEQVQSLLNSRRDGGGSSSGGRSRNNQINSSGFRDGLPKELNDNGSSVSNNNKEQGYSQDTKSIGNDSLNNSKSGSQTQLCEITNRLPSDASASFSSPGELQKRLNESDCASQSTSNLNLHAPIMTSFREIANSQTSLAISNDSPMCLSLSSETAEESWRRSKSAASDTNGLMCKFIRLDDSIVSTTSQSSSARSESRNADHPAKSIFPMFIELGAHDNYISDEMAMSQSVPPTNDMNSIRNRAILARRLSVSSLNSLTSIDLTPTHEGPPVMADKKPVSQLGEDLLQMYLDEVDSDMSVITSDGELQAHRVILWAACPAFRAQLAKQKSVHLESFTKSTVNFLLMFFYGGLTCVPDDIDCFELVTLADQLQLDTLMQVALLHFRTYRCHFFHRPCATCVSSILDALPQFHKVPALRFLYEEAIAWQAKHFSRIWKGRIFLHMSEHWQKTCFDALIQEITESSVIDVLLGCEKLQVALPRIKAQHSNQFVQRLVNDVVEFCTDFLITAFDGVISSKAFAQQGRGLALNLSLIEDIFPTLVHSLNADTAIRAFICLKNLLLEIVTEQKSERNVGSQRSLHGSSLSIHQTDEYNPRFFNLCKRLYELTDKHLLHFAASVVQAESYSLLTANEQNRIQEAGIFVEMRLPKAPPPQFSSFNRAYKRSSSVGFQQSINSSYERTRSLERARPVTTFSQLLEADEPLEVIIEREKSQTQIQLHRRSASMRENSTSKIALRNDSSRIPAKMAIKRSSNTEAIKNHESPTIPKTKKEEPGSMESRQKVKEFQTKAKTEKKSRKDEPELKSSFRRRSTNRLKCSLPTQPVRSFPPPVPDSIKLEREMTQTIMTVEQMKERGINPAEMGMPEIQPLKPSSDQNSSLCASPAATLTLSSETLTHSPTPTVIHTNIESTKAKPRSVVKPMPKTALQTSGKTSSTIRTSGITKKSANANVVTATSSNTEETRLNKPIRSALPTRKTSPSRGVPIKTTMSNPANEVSLSIDEKPRKGASRGLNREKDTKIPHSPMRTKRT